MGGKSKKEIFILSIVITILSIMPLIFVIANYPKLYSELKMVAIISIFCAGVIAATGLIFFCMILAFYKAEKKLKKFGKTVYAQFDSVWKTKGEKPYIIVCKYKDETGEELKLKSIGLDFNPECAIKDLGISTFPVYIYTQNNKKYTVDLKQLTENLVDLR